MKKIFAVITYALFFIACSPSKEEIEKQEKQYDHIADSVIKNAETYDDGVGSITDSAAFKNDSLLIEKKSQTQ